MPAVEPTAAEKHIEGDPEAAKQQESAEDEQLRKVLDQRRADREAKLEEQAGRGARQGRELIESLDSEDPPKLKEDEVVDATDWFLSEDAEDYSAAIQLNVGTTRKPKWVEWVIQPVDMDVLRKIRRRAQGGNRAQRRAAAAGAPVELDENAANLQIVIEGTVSPDLRALVEQTGAANRSELLRERFQHKPGLIGQIAGEVMGLSGYDDEDVREVDEVRAAGN